VDACNTIMDSHGWPRGLVRYDSDSNMQSKRADSKPHLYWLNIKTVGYGVVLSLMTGLLVYKLASRTEFEESVQQVRQPLYVTLSDGSIRNRYQVRITNKTDHVQTYVLSTRGVPDKAVDYGDSGNLVDVRAGKSMMVQVNVALPREVAEKQHELEFIITPKGLEAQSVAHKVRFHARPD
jgi:polyferredoxin